MALFDAAPALFGGLTSAPDAEGTPQSIYQRLTQAFQRQQQQGQPPVPGEPAPQPANSSPQAGGVLGQALAQGPPLGGGAPQAAAPRGMAMDVLGPALPNPRFTNPSPAPAAAPAGGAPAQMIPGTQIPMSAMPRIAGQQGGQMGALPDDLVPAGMPLGNTYLNPRGPGYTMQQPSWQNVPLAPGLPTYQDVLRATQSTDIATPEARQQAMHQFGQLLGQTAQAQTALGHLGVAQGDLGLRGTQAMGFGGIPGSIANEAARTGEVVAGGQYARSHQALADTATANVLTALAQQGVQPTTQMADQVRRAFGGAIQGAPGTPGAGPMGATVPGAGQMAGGSGILGGAAGPNNPVMGAGPAAAPAAGGAPPAPTVGANGRPTGNTPLTPQIGDQWTQIMNQFGNRGRLDDSRANEALTQFFSTVQPTGQNINSVRQMLLENGATQTQLNNWLTQRDIRNSSDAGAAARRSVRGAMNQVQPGFIGGQSFNVQSPPWVGANPGVPIRLLINRLLGGDPNQLRY